MVRLRQRWAKDMEFTEFELSVFLDEVEEKLNVLSDNVLILEQDHDNEDAVKEMFRAAHTIKGSSGIMGFEKMTRLTHEMENVLDKIRNGTLEINSSIVNLIFECIDALKLLQDEIISKEDQVVVEPLLEKIRLISDDPKTVSTQQTQAYSETGFDEVEVSVMKEAKLKGFLPLWITISLDPECQMKGVRAYLVFHNLQDFGEVIKTEPCIEDLQDGNFEQEFKVLLLSSQEAEKVKSTLQVISEVNSVDVFEVMVGESSIESSTDVTETKETDADSIITEKQSVKEEPPAKTMEDNKVLPNNRDVRKLNKVEKKLNPTVRVNVEKLDKLMNLVGELVIDRGRLGQVTNDLGVKIGSDELLERLGEITSHLAQVANELQDEIMKARMLPVDQVFNRFPRMVRDIAQKLNKEINFNVSGGDTELDRTVIEAIGDPLVHLIRNAVDHGVELPEERLAKGKPKNGTINLSARHQENYVMITVEDDGKGIDSEAIKAKAVAKGIIAKERASSMSHQEALELIFYPGFSTAEKVNDISGRGVGMDIVRNHIQSINGLIEIESKLGHGTTFYIKLPLTLAIIQALLVKVAEQTYSLPLANVTEIFKISPNDIQYIHRQEVAVIRGSVLPLYSLSEVFHLSGKSNFREKDDIFVVVVGIGEKHLGIVVDQLLGEQEIVIKTLGDYLGEIPGISGATILGDGSVALIVDIRGLIVGLKKAYENLQAV